MRAEVLKVGRVRESIFNVDLGIDQRSVPKADVLVKRVETVDRTGAGPRSIRGGAGDEGDENSRRESNTPGIPRNDIVISTSQTVQELTGASKGEVDTGFTRSTCGVSEWRPYMHSGERQRADLDR